MKRTGKSLKSNKLLHYIVFFCLPFDWIHFKWFSQWGQTHCQEFHRVQKSNVVILEKYKLCSFQNQFWLCSVACNYVFQNELCVVPEICTRILNVENSQITLKHCVPQQLFLCGDPRITILSFEIQHSHDGSLMWCIQLFLDDHLVHNVHMFHFSNSVDTLVCWMSTLGSNGEPRTGRDAAVQLIRRLCSKN